MEYGANWRGNIVRNVITNFVDFVDENTNDDDDNDNNNYFAFVEQENRFGSNRAKRHVSFTQGGTFSQMENYQDFRHRDDLGAELGTIKLKKPAFQGKIDPKAHLE